MVVGCGRGTIGVVLRFVLGLLPIVAFVTNFFLDMIIYIPAYTFTPGSDKFFFGDTNDYG